MFRRFYDIEAGSIRLDEQEVRDLNLAALRTAVGVVSQEPVLFSTTIEENLRLGKPDLR